MKNDKNPAPKQKKMKTNTQTVEISVQGIDKAENSVYNNSAEQSYRPITRGKAAEFNIRSDSKISAKRVDTYADEVYISDKANIKPRALHEIKQMTDAARDEWGIETKPKIIIVDADEMPNALGKYDPVENTVYYISKLNESSVIETVGGQGFVEYHEMWHMRQAENFRLGGRKITAKNRGEYIKALCQRCKKNIERLGVTYDNVGDISEYAESQFLRGRYDEVEAEFMVKRRQK